MDIFFIHGLVDELAILLPGHRPGKAFQVGTTDLLLDFNLRDHRWLHISTDPSRLGCYLSRRAPRKGVEVARSDTPFVELLRKHLDGLRLSTIEGLGYDRVIRLRFGDDETRRERDLIIALTGRSANIFLVEGCRLITELREREVVTEEYDDPPPPRDRIDPFTCTPARLREVIDNGGGDTEAVVQRVMLGFTPLLSRELAARAESSGSIESAWPGMIDDLGGRMPAIYADPPLDQLRREPGCDEFQMVLSSLPLTHLSRIDCRRYPSLNEAAADYFGLIEERRQFISLRQRLMAALNVRQKRLVGLLANLDREVVKYAENERWQREGELLLANIHQAISTGVGTFLVVDFFDPEQRLIEIAAADKGTPREAAEHYFRMARKGRHALESIASRRPGVESELAAVISDRESLVACRTLTDLEPFAQRSGLVGKIDAEAKRTAHPGRQPVEERIPGTRRFTSSDGYQILVGRTDRDNDYLTQRVAKSHDMWFHAADYPGSHVVLRNPGRQPVPQRSIIEAARLAAKFSQARHLPRAAVNYCEKKFVTKPKGFAVGQVRLSSFRTIMVEPANDEFTLSGSGAAGA